MKQTVRDYVVRLLDDAVFEDADEQADALRDFLPEYLRPDTDLATVVDTLLTAKAAKAAAPVPIAQPTPISRQPEPAPAPAAKPRFRKLVKEDLEAWSVDVADDAGEDEDDDGRHFHSQRVEASSSQRVDSGSVG